MATRRRATREIWKPSQTRGSHSPTVTERKVQYRRHSAQDSAPFELRSQRAIGQKTAPTLLGECCRRIPHRFEKDQGIRADGIQLLLGSKTAQRTCLVKGRSADAGLERRPGTKPTRVESAGQLPGGGGVSGKGITVQIAGSGRSASRRQLRPRTPTRLSGPHPGTWTRAALRTLRGRPRKHPQRTTAVPP